MAIPDICVIKSDQLDIFFTVTTKYTLSRDAAVTNYKIESGRSVTDHHSANNKRFVFSGLVTSDSILGGDPSEESLTPATLYRALDGLIGSGELFTLVTDNEMGFDSIDDCVLTSYAIDREESLGNAVEVSVDIQQIQSITSGERTALQQPSEEKKAQLSSEKKNGASATKEVTLEEHVILNAQAQANRG